MQDQDWTGPMDVMGQEGSNAVREARMLIQQGRIPQARQILEGVLNEDAGNAPALVAYAMTFQRKGDLEEAAGYLEDAMAADPANGTAPLMAGLLGLQGKDYDYAERNFARALELNPQSQPALMGMVRLRRKNGDADGVIKILERMVEIDPQSVKARHQLAKALVDADRPEEARANLEHVLTYKPGDVRTLERLSKLLNADGDGFDPVDKLEQALAEEPDNVRLMISLGRAQLRAQAWTDAEQTFRRALTMNAAPAMVNGPLAEALIGQKKLAEARKMISQMPRRGPKRSSAQRLHAEAFAAEENWKAAADSYRAALMALPGEDGQALLQQLEGEVADLQGAALVASYREAYGKLRTDRAPGKGGQVGGGRSGMRRGKGPMAGGADQMGGMGGGPKARPGMGGGRGMMRGRMMAPAAAEGEDQPEQQAGPGFRRRGMFRRPGNRQI